MKVIVVGGGKIGFYLTQTLLEHGHEPVLIEKDPDVCLRVANSLDLPVIQGDGTVLDTLENAGIRDCDALIGVSGQDESNLVACSWQTLFRCGTHCGPGEQPQKPVGHETAGSGYPHQQYR